MGTANFMSPEQAADEPVDGRSDIYSLGVVGYLAASGRLPFGSSNLPPALPPALRAWLAARNPLFVPYVGWSAGFSFLTLASLVVWLTGNRPNGPADIVRLASIASLPMIPIVRDDEEDRTHRALRIGTVTSATWLGVTARFFFSGAVHENRIGAAWYLGPMFGTMLIGAVSNALEVRFIPDGLRKWWPTGVRDRLWNSRAGEWLARRLGAPERSRAVGGGVFRATEAALGVAASELFAALPTAYREPFAELPTIVAAAGVVLAVSALG